MIQLATQEFCDRFVDYRIDPVADYLHEAAKHILAQKSKFSRWLDNERPETAANALLILPILPTLQILMKLQRD